MSIERSKTPEEIRENLQSKLNNAAEEIKQNGVSSLYVDGQYVTGARIILEIDDQMITTVRYEKSVAVPAYCPRTE